MSRNFGDINDQVQVEWEFNIEGEMEENDFVTIKYNY